MILRDDTLAEDALQDVFAKVLAREVVLGGQEPLKLLYVMATRVAIDHQRKSKRTPSGEALFDDRMAGPACDPSLLSALRTLFAEMTDDERALSVLVFRDGLTQEEAADLLGVSRVTVNKRVQEIRQRAKSSIGDS